MLSKGLFLISTSVMGCSKRHVPKTVVAKVVPPDRVEAAQVAPEPTEFGPWQTRQNNWTGQPVIRDPVVQWSHTLSGPIIHSITSDSDQVYVVSSGDLFCFGVDGQPIWKTSINADGAAVPMSGGIHVPNGLGAMQVLARDTGEILHSYGGKTAVRTGPLLLRSKPLWVDDAGNVVTEAGATQVVTDGSVGGAASDGTIAVIGSSSKRVYSGSTRRRAATQHT